MSLCGILLKGLGPSGGTALAVPSLALADGGNGTATATIAGSTPGATNTLYFEPVGQIVAGGGWTTAGSRGGDGTIVASVPQGYYWWLVASSLGVDVVNTAPIYQNVTDGLASVHWQCLLAAQARIQALSLAAIDNDTSVVVKKLALERILGALKQGGLGVPLPAIVLFPLAEEENPAQGVNALDDVDYGIGCLIVAVDNQEPTVAALMASFLLWRQQISRSLRNQTFAGLPASVFSLAVRPRALYNAPAWSANYDVSLVELRFLSREARGLDA